MARFSTDTQTAPSAAQVRFAESLMSERAITLDDVALRVWGSTHVVVGKRECSTVIDVIKRHFPRLERERPAAPVLEAGMYLVAPGEIYKVKISKSSGKPYAEKLCRDGSGDDGPADVWFEYAPGAVRSIKPEHRMTMDQAATFGAMFGSCCVCGRTLTNAKSIEAGIGPVCAGRL